jgi:hypothetical protein
LELRVGGGRLLRLAPGLNILGGGSGNFIGPGVLASVIAGGGAGAGGSGTNVVNSSYGTISGGRGNEVAGAYAAIGGGFDNLSSGIAATVPGGGENVAAGDYSLAAGRRSKANHYGTFVWSDDGSSDFASTATHQFLINAIGGVGIGHNAPSGPLHVVGGLGATLTSGGTLILGAVDQANLVFDSQDVQARNAAAAANLYLNRFGGNVSVGNPAGLVFPNNVPNAPLHVFGGGDVGLSGGGSLVLGGVSGVNMALDVNEIQVRNNGAAAALLVNAGGGNVSIGTTSTGARLRVVNATCDGASWINSSDRNLKEAFEPVDAQAILAKVAALPLSRWNYTNAPGARHLGPMAQNFQAAFGLGADDKSIATVDADGVALAAIQGLNQKLEEARQENTTLRQRLEKLERLLQRFAGE